MTWYTDWRRRRLLRWVDSLDADITSVREDKHEIILGVHQKRPVSALESTNVIPKYKGHLWWKRRIRVITNPLTSIHRDIPYSSVQNVRNIPDTNTYDPLQGGIQISAVGGIGVGTLGITIPLSFYQWHDTPILLPAMSQKVRQKLLKDTDVTQTAAVVGITNHHVVATSPQSTIKRVIKHGNTLIGRVMYSTPVRDSYTNMFDLALIALDPTVQTDTHHVVQIGACLTWKDPVVGTRVVKRGRTSRRTTGTCVARGVDVKINYGTANAPDYYWLRDMDVYSYMSLGGDSGSVIVDEATNDVVGLLFAGNGLYTYAMPAGRVIDKIRSLV